MKYVKKKIFLFLVINVIFIYKISCSQYKWEKKSTNIEYLLWLIDDNITAHVFKIPLFFINVKIISQNKGVLLPIIEQISIYKYLKNYIAINASFFDESNNPMGYIVSENKVIQHKIISKWGTVLFYDNKVKFIYGNEIKNELKPFVALQGTPFLIKNSVKSILKEQIATRTILCEAKNNFYVIKTTRISFQKITNALINKPLECINALNLDGGTSSQISVKLEKYVFNISSTGVPNTLIFEPK